MSTVLMALLRSLSMEARDEGGGNARKASGPSSLTGGSSSGWRDREEGIRMEGFEGSLKRRG